MIVIAGLVILIVAVIAAVAGVLGNTGSSHAPARRRLERSRHQTAAVSQDRDDLISQRDAARASTAGALGNGPDRGDHSPRARDSRPGWLGLSRGRPQPPRITALNGAAAKGAAEPG